MSGQLLSRGDKKHLSVPANDSCIKAAVGSKSVRSSERIMKEPAGSEAVRAKPGRSCRDDVRITADKPSVARSMAESDRRMRNYLKVT